MQENVDAFTPKSVTVTTEEIDHVISTMYKGKQD